MADAAWPPPPPRPPVFAAGGADDVQPWMASTAATASPAAESRRASRLRYATDWQNTVLPGGTTPRSPRVRGDCPSPVSPLAPAGYADWPFLVWAFSRVGFPAW